MFRHMKGNSSARRQMQDATLAAAERLRRTTGRLCFRPPVAHVYRPLEYAWAAHEIYLRRFARTRKRAIFLGMNPGPFGMVQTGIPFGEIGAVRDWLGIHVPIRAPKIQHPKRLIRGFDCPRSEISGQRLWRLFGERFGTAENFFADYFVVNYCPLAFLEESGCNRTPDKLSPNERLPLFAACDQHLRAVVAALEPEWLIGIGDFAARRAREIFPESSPKIARILHPSPASPAANRDWAGLATEQLEEAGVWPAIPGSARF